MFGIRPYRKNESEIWNPFSEMQEMQRRFFGNDFFSNGSLADFRTDITDEGSHYELKADMPGFRKEDINLELDGDMLTIKAERHSEHEKQDKKNKYVCCERSYGAYSRSFDMSGVDTSRISASYKEGVLELKLPKKANGKPSTKRIAIN